MKDERLGLRVSPELKQALSVRAAADGRSLSDYVVRVLQAHVRDAAGK